MSEDTFDGHMETDNFGMSHSIAKLATALAKAQAEMQHAAKDNVNPHFRSRYADLAGVMDACREPLANNGLSYVQMPTCDGQFAEVRTILMHVSGEYIWSTLSVPLSKRDAQGVGSALTYARRYSLSAVVGIAQDDDDGNAASQGNQAAPQKKAQAKKAARKPAKKNPEKDGNTGGNGGASATAVLLGFAQAIDTCTTADEVDAAGTSWSEKIDKMKRGSDYAYAYARVRRAAILDEEAQGEDIDLASYITKLQAKGD